MLKTPLTVLLVLRCLILLSVGEAGASSMAESTLLRGWLVTTSADMIDDGVGAESWLFGWLGTNSMELTSES
jgi:hypothetical protein